MFDPWGNRCDEFGNPIGNFQGGMGAMYNHGQGQSGGRRPTRRELLDYIANTLQTNDIVTVDEFETERARHVCPSGGKIWVLDRKFLEIPSPVGVVRVQYYMCGYCKKVIVDKNSLEFL